MDALGRGRRRRGRRRRGVRDDAVRPRRRRRRVRRDPGRAARAQTACAEPRRGGRGAARGTERLAGAVRPRRAARGRARADPRGDRRGRPVRHAAGPPPGRPRDRHDVRRAACSAHASSAPTSSSTTPQGHGTRASSPSTSCSTPPAASGWPAPPACCARVAGSSRSPRSRRRLPGSPACTSSSGPNRLQLVQIAELLDGGWPPPAVDSVFALEDAASAFERSMRADKRGKVVLDADPRADPTGPGDKCERSGDASNTPAWRPWPRSRHRRRRAGSPRGPVRRGAGRPGRQRRGAPRARRARSR